MFAFILSKIGDFFSSISNFIKRILHLEGPEENDFPRPGKGSEIICYYGCPNSQRVKKLQLEKKLYR